MQGHLPCLQIVPCRGQPLLHMLHGFHESRLHPLDFHWYHLCTLSCIYQEVVEEKGLMGILFPGKHYRAQIKNPNKKLAHQRNRITDIRLKGWWSINTQNNKLQEPLWAKHSLISTIVPKSKTKIKNMCIREIGWLTYFWKKRG